MNTALNRKCALCRNFGHQITQCMDATSLEQIQHDKTIFTFLINTRLREPEHISPGFCNFIVEMHKTPKHLLRFFVMKYGSRTRRLNKSRLCAKYIYHLFDNYMTNASFNGILPHLIEIMQVEKKYWLKVGNGAPKEAALVEYGEEMERIAIEESMNQQIRILRDMRAKKDPMEAIDIQFIAAAADWEDKPPHVNTVDNNTHFECGICYETVSEQNSILLNCKHSFCGLCVVKTVRTCYENDTSACCAMCRAEYREFTVRSSAVLNLLTDKTI